MGLLYSLALWIALFTTALANAHSLTKDGCKTYLSYKKVLFLVIVSTVIFILIFQPWWGGVSSSRLFGHTLNSYLHRTTWTII